MTGSDEIAERVEELLDVPHLADALESEQFRHFLDQIPIAIAVSDLKGPEHIVYANPEFEKLSGQSAAELEGKPWSALHGQRDAGDLDGELGVAVVEASDCVGTFHIEALGREPAIVDAYSNVIDDDGGTPAFRLVALVDVTAHEKVQRDELEQRVRRRTRPIIPVGGLMANAVANALASFGAMPNQLPLSPARVWRMVVAA